MIRYESSRCHKIDGTKPNQTGNTVGHKKKQGKQTEGNRQKSTTQQRTSSPGRDTEVFRKPFYYFILSLVAIVRGIYFTHEDRVSVR